MQSALQDLSGFFSSIVTCFIQPPIVCLNGLMQEWIQEHIMKIFFFGNNSLGFMWVVQVYVWGSGSKVASWWVKAVMKAWTCVWTLRGKFQRAASPRFIPASSVSSCLGGIQGYMLWSNQEMAPYPNRALSYYWNLWAFMFKWAYNQY